MQSDAATLGLCLALQLALLCSSAALGSPSAGWASNLALAATATALTLVLAAKPLCVGCCGLHWQWDAVCFLGAPGGSAA